MPTDVVSDNRIGCFFCFATHRLLIQRIGCSFLQNGGITTFNTHRLNVCYMPPMPSGWSGGIRTQSLGFLTDIGITQESARIPKHRIINLVLTLQRQEIKESPLTPKIFLSIICPPEYSLASITPYSSKVQSAGY